MNESQLQDLEADPTNPRVISKDEFSTLKKLLKKYGDLSGIVKNERTGQLVGGHMRVQAFIDSKSENNIQIIERLESPTSAGTIAYGFVNVNGERFTYRVVDWDEGTQKAANIAANKAGGDFDKDILGEVMYEISQLENGTELLEDTAFTQKEIDNIMKISGAAGDEGDEPDEEKEPRFTFKISEENQRTIEQLVKQATADHQLTGKDQEVINGKAMMLVINEYLANHPLPNPGEFTPPEIPQL